MKKLLLVLLLLSFNLTLAAQTSVSATTQPQSATQPQAKVSRTSKAINFGRAGSTKLDLHGTDSMPRGYGELKIQSKNGRIEVDAKVGALDQASRFGLEYLTYVLWAVSPQGRADNLGELILDEHGSSKLKATTELQTFGLLVTAEPYFAVTQPSSLVVLENDALPGTGREQQIEFSYELLGRDAYSSSNQRIDNAIFGIDPNTPLELFEARNARENRACRQRRQVRRSGTREGRAIAATGRGRLSPEAQQQGSASRVSPATPLRMRKTRASWR